MSYLNKFWVKETFEITGLWIFGMLISIALPAAAGFIGGAFEQGFLGEYMQKYIFYYGFVFGGLFYGITTFITLFMDNLIVIWNFFLDWCGLGISTEG